MTDIIQANYEDLEQVANRFGKQAQAIQEMLNKVQRAMQPLKQGGWVGVGSDAFFAEMEGKILPAVRRLAEALTEAERATKQISQTFSSNEQQAATLFLSETDGGGSDATAGDGGADTGEAGAGESGAWGGGGFAPGSGDDALDGALRDNGFGSTDGTDLGEFGGGGMGGAEYTVPEDWLKDVQESPPGETTGGEPVGDDATGGGTVPGDGSEDDGGAYPGSGGGGATDGGTPGEIGTPGDGGAERGPVGDGGIGAEDGAPDGGEGDATGDEFTGGEGGASGGGSAGGSGSGDSGAPTGGGGSGAEAGGEPTGNGGSAGQTGSGPGSTGGSGTAAHGTPGGGEKAATTGPLGYAHISGAGGEGSAGSKQTPAVAYREFGRAAAAPPTSGGLPIGLAALGPLLAVVGKAIKRRTERN